MLNKEFVLNLKSKVGTDADSTKYLDVDNVTAVYAFGAYHYPLAENADKISLMHRPLENMVDLNNLISNCPDSEIRVMFVCSNGNNPVYTVKGTFFSEEE